MPIAQFSGLASGIDSQSLIDAYVEAIQKKNDLRKAEITEITDQSDTLVEFKDKLKSLNDLIDKFRTANAGGLAKKASSIDGSIATASVSSAAKNSSYALTVTSLANTATASFDQSYSASTDVISAGGGDISVVVGTGADQITIVKTLTGSTTIGDFVADFNADETNANRVVASSVNIGTEGSPDYRIVFNTLESGTDKGNIVISSTTAELTTSTVNQASNAEFSIGGIGTSITRSSNTVSDIVSGVSFSLVDTGTTTITVTNDPDKTASELQEVVEAYNEIVTFLAENNTVERVSNSSGATNVYGKLAKTRTDNDFLSVFRGQISGTTSTIGTAVKKLSELGITTNRFDGTLNFDETAFKTAVSKDPTGVADVLNKFADSTAGVNGVIYQYTKTSGFIDTTIASNNSTIQNISESIAQLDRRTDKVKARLTSQFSNLESVTAELQSKQSQLSGILAGL